MSTSTKIVITPENTGLWNIQQSEEAAQAASELLQKDLEVRNLWIWLGVIRRRINMHLGTSCILEQQGVS